MSKTGKIWIGADPGGKGKFGLAIIKGDSLAFAGCASNVDEALGKIDIWLDGAIPSAAGIDAPLWWSSGPAGLRLADKWIRDTYKGKGIQPRNVQSVNSLWGSVLAQGMLLVERLRSRYPNLDVTETHPKALIVALESDYWIKQFKSLECGWAWDLKSDDQRDAIISAIAAKEAFGTEEWTNDLSLSSYASEQNPKEHWLAPVSYFWPVMSGGSE